MENHEATTSSSANNNDLFAQLESYPWDSDEEFQGGLSAILGPNPSSPEQVSELTLRARCFYYSRKHGLAVDFDSYKAYRAQHAHPPYTKPSRTDIPPEGVTHGGVGGAGAVSSTTSAAEGDTFPSASTPAAATAAPAAAVQTSSSSPSSSSSSDPNAPYPTSFAHIVDLITKGEPVPGIREIPDVVWEGRESQSTTAPRKKPWETAARESSADVYNTSADSHVEGVANEGVAS